MCGFFTVISKGKIDEKQFSLSLNKINHRGPDNQKIKFYKIDKINFALGFNRLSIQDPIERSDQPFSLDNQKILMFNGEIYNFNDLIKKNNLKTLTRSDTEVFYKILCEKNTNSFEELNGMWAITFFDFINKKVILSRDRYGQKPLYYFLDNNILIISSSPQSINYYLGSVLNFNKKTVTEYMEFGFNYNNKSLFNKITKVENSSFELFDFNKWKFTKKEKYFNHSDIVHNQNSLTNLKNDLSAAVNRTLISDRPVGLLLSGGIDSQMILRLAEQSDKNFNINYYCMYHDESDLDYVNTKLVADQLKLNVNFIKDPGKMSLSKFKEICKFQHNLFPLIGSVVSSNQIYEKISQTNTKVVLDGCGADEIFAGYDYRYFFPFLRQLFRDEKYIKFIKELKQVNKQYYVFYLKDLIKSIFPYLKKFRKKNKYLKENIIENNDPIFKKKFAFNELLKIESFEGRLGLYLSHLDENSMMYGLENRSPFLDKEIIKYLNSNYEDKIFNGSYKDELKNVLRSFDLPKNFITNKKKGLSSTSLNNFFDTNKTSLTDQIMDSQIIKDVGYSDLIYRDIKKNNIDNVTFSRLSVTAVMEQQ
jgi:asparagine synthase (glutamine-hydrolysing)